MSGPVVTAPPIVGVELGYAEVTSTLTASSTTYADAAGWTVTVTVGSRPIVIRAWSCLSPNNNTLNDGPKAQLLRTDTGDQLAECNYLSYTAGGPTANIMLQRRLSIAAGTTVTFKVQIGCRVGGTATFGATATAPLCIEVVQV